MPDPITIPADLLNIVDQVSALAKRFEAVTRLNDALRSIGSLDQAARETEARLGRATQEEVMVRAKLESLQEQAGKVSASIAADLATAAHDAEMWQSDGKQAAEKILADARAQSERTIAGAQQYQSIQKTGADKVLRDAQDEANSLRQSLAKYNDEIKLAQSVLADLRTRIELARSEGRRIFGG
jgi:seryl-tRNA synthetase